MIENAKWKNRHFRGDATICANEIEQIGDNVTPQQIVEFAKDESNIKKVRNNYANSKEK